MNVDIKTYIRTIPNYPKEGVMFRDITSLWQDPVGLRTAIDRLIWPYVGVRIDKVAGIEARGFVLGGAIAHQLGVGFVPVRKQGKLPCDTIGVEYELEYGKDVVEVHKDAINEGENILIVDDLIATGGTAEAAIKLVRQAKGTVIGAAFVIDLPDIGGRARIESMGVNVRTLCEFEGD
ncbi:MAG: adenine phosphoribosyltransferase [Sneathiella sp.]